MASKSIKNRLLDVSVRTQSFVPQGESQPIEYHQVVFLVEYNGDPEEVTVKCDKKTLQLLKAADVEKQNLLETEQGN